MHGFGCFICKFALGERVDVNEWSFNLSYVVLCFTCEGTEI